jgi:heme-degrading monooxygenase HmoA
MVTALDGCVGLSMLVDRESGRCIVTSSWETREAMEASAEQVRDARGRAGEMLGGEPQVEEWEVAVMHRVHPTHEGACCRVTWVELQGGDAERLLEDYKREVLPQIEQLEGFCSASLLVDRVTGRGCGSVAFESREAMERTREQSAKIRETGMNLAVRITDVEEFELALAHFRVPEMA